MLTAELQGNLQVLQAAWMSFGFLLEQQSHNPSHQDCEWDHNHWLAGRDNRWEKIVESSWSLARLKNIRCNCYLPYQSVTDGARLQGHCWNMGIVLCAHHFLAQLGAKPSLWQTAMQSFANIIAYKTSRKDESCFPDCNNAYLIPNHLCFCCQIINKALWLLGEECAEHQALWWTCENLHLL